MDFCLCIFVTETSDRRLANGCPTQSCATYLGAVIYSVKRNVCFLSIMKSETAQISIFCHLNPDYY